MKRKYIEEGLPKIFLHRRQNFWRIYLGSLAAILLLTAGIVLMVAGWEELLAEINQFQARDGLVFLLILICYSIPLLTFYFIMCASQNQCLEQYATMSAHERKRTDLFFLQRGAIGDVTYTEKHFIYRDKYRLFFPYIYSYKEIIWAYMAQSFYPQTEMEPFLFRPEMSFHSIIFITSDGRRHSIFMGKPELFTNHLPMGVILGYGREQKRQAKEKLWLLDEYDQTLAKKRRARKWKGIGALTSVILVLALLIWQCYLLL